MPTALLRKGLQTALVELKDRIAYSSGLEIAFSYPDAIDLSQQISIQVFRIIQELIHNSLRHAKASQLKIDISIKGKDLLVFYQDNGVGFDYPLMQKQSTGIELRSPPAAVKINVSFPPFKRNIPCRYKGSFTAL